MSTAAEEHESTDDAPVAPDAAAAASEAADSTHREQVVIDLEHRRLPQSITRTRGGVGWVTGRPSTKSLTSCR